MKRTTPRVILGVGWLAFLLYAYPGYLKIDAADQLADSRTGAFTDWHSPMMTEVWRIVGRVISGPPGMLFLQSLLLLAGSYHLLRRAMSVRAAAITSVCVLVVPPLIATTALVSAEAQLASFLVAGAAALASPQLRIRLVGLGLMMVACGMRDGGTIAALPIIVTTFHWGDEPRWRRLAIAAGAWLVIAGAACGANRLLVDVRTERTEVALATSDVIGTLRYASDLTDPKVVALLPNVSLAVTTDIQHQVRDVYGKTSKYSTIVNAPTTDDERDAILAARSAIARAMPGAYLKHRWHIFRGALGFAQTWSPVHTEFVDAGAREGLQHAARHSLVQSLLIRPLHWMSHSFLFRPYVYLILALVLVPIAAFRRQLDTTVLLASGIVYELALLFEANRAEYRDSHWMIAATILAIILLVARKLRPEGTIAARENSAESA